ncbi:hypothetical protein K8R04_05230, partial [Candidatus Uhrbacteria bacterium]|nr:hypothetical protein [Candidatus Uhrbacteria bacterium]
MATIKTIKPAGGGDYTTLAAWWTFAAAQATADQWAECYSGGDLGPIDDSGGMAATSDATHYPQIYVAGGHEHGGGISAGAYTTGIVSFGNVNYWHVIGLRVGNNSASNLQLFGTGFFMDRCLAVHTSGISGSLMFVIFNGGLETSYVRNCAAYSIVTGSTAFDLFNGGPTFIDNCTAVSRNGNGNRGFRLDLVYADTITLRNCVACGFNQNGDYEGSAFGGTIVMSTCVSSDATADDFGGSGNLINQNFYDLFADPLHGDFRLRPGSALIDAGANLSADFTTDIVGRTRPASGPWDIGAFEYVQQIGGYDFCYSYDEVGNRTR